MTVRGIRRCGYSGSAHPATGLRSSAAWPRTSASSVADLRSVRLNHPQRFLRVAAASFDRLRGIAVFVLETRADLRFPDAEVLFAMAHLELVAAREEFFLLGRQFGLGADYGDGGLNAR